MSSLAISINPNNIHQGPGNLWFNVPVPATGGRIVLAADQLAAPATGAVWVLDTVYLAGSQVVDSNGNLQRAVNSGESAGTQPTWTTTIGTTVVDGTVTWECISLGAVYYAGAVEGATTAVFAPKIEEIMADQVAGPIDNVIVSAMASIEVEMKETDMLKMANYFAGGIYGAGTDSAQPTGAQAYQQLSFGGLIVVPKLSMAVISPRRNNLGKFVVSQLYKCSQAEQISYAVTRTKETMLKMKFTGLFDPTRPQGDQAGMLWWQV
jgi:hypothetical protein